MGAAYTFLLWGVYHGVLLIIERVTLRQGYSLPSILAWPLTILLIMIGWVLFRAPNIATTGAFIKAMAGFGADGSEAYISAFVTPDKVTYFLVERFSRSYHLAEF